ncbi:MAG: hypothetical protein H0X34_13325 [Chthoniobacterales bacterium]|nr:hypothetical protein [Chthoniobacterales bacterium]
MLSRRPKGSRTKKAPHTPWLVHWSILEGNACGTNPCDHSLEIVHLDNEDEQLEIVILRSGEKSIFVNLDIPMVEHPEDVPWTDPIHQ